MVALLFVLGGAAGLVLLGLTGMHQALRSAEDSARIDAERSALATARGIRTALADPNLLDHFDPAHRFSWEGGGPIVPEAVAWVVRPPSENPERDTPRALADRLREASQAEFVDGDPDAAAVVYDRVLDDPLLPPRQRPRVRVAAAWCAHRAGDATRRDAFLDRLVAPFEHPLDARDADAAQGDRKANRSNDGSRDASPDSETLPLDRATAAGAILLAAAADRPYPTVATARFRSFPPAEARTVLDRLHELEAARAGVRLTALESAFDETVRRRHTLRIAIDHRTEILRASAPLHVTNRGDLVLYHPASESAPDADPYESRMSASGRGAVVPLAEAIAAIRRASKIGDRATPPIAAAAAIPWSCDVVYGDTFPDGAVPVLAGVGVVPNHASPAIEPWMPVAIFVLLGATLAFGLVLSIRAIREERAAIAVRDEFLSAVTHELKTPLASIQLLGEMLHDGRDIDDVARDRYHRRLAAETGRLRMILDNVLDLGRAERHESAYELQTVDLRDVVDDTLRVFEPLAERDDLAVGVRHPESTTATLVRADRDSLRQALLNVLENARRHAAGSAGLEPPTASPNRSIHIETRSAGTHCALRIRDHGPGVPPEERDAIFEKFRRGRDAAASGNPGVGLGLFLARCILRDHGGDLRYEAPDDGGRGACFVATIPRADASTPGDAVHDAEPAADRTRAEP